MISIIVPVYHVEKYLRQCIDSLMNQNYREIEIILVDDGSIDKCSEICDDYIRMDLRIYVIHQKNAGVSTARNAGLCIAKGEYVGFVDPDDWVSPDMYKSMLKNLGETKADLAICGYAYCHDDGSVDNEREYQRKCIETISQKEVMKRMSDIPPTIRHVIWNKLFRRNLLKGICFPEYLHSSEDVWFLTEYLLRTKSAVFVHEPYYNNRVREGSATHGGLNIHSLAESFQSHYFMYRSIIKVYPDLKEYSQAFLLDVYLLKYKEVKRKISKVDQISANDLADIKRMKATILAEAKRAIFNHDIYWKTRLAYLLVK